MKKIIIIPVYKERPDKTELISLHQCLKILNQHRICLVIPDNLDTTAYQSVFRGYNHPFQTESFDPSFFKDIAGYNRLMLSKHFYERFADFDYMLIYQLDAYVFRDELDDWCAKGYDFIGAPWMKVTGGLDEENSGNGGFSLRKISSFIKIFSHTGKILTFKGLMCYHRYRGPLHKPWLVVSGLFGKNNSLEYFTNHVEEGEDLFYVTLKHKKCEKLKIPRSDEAMFFSFEQSPACLFQKAGNRLPFGCHAWLKYDYDSFWKRYIPIN
jgi:hypothetical protein